MNTCKSITCACGSNTIELTFHEGMPAEVVNQAYCPVCDDHGFVNRDAFPIPGGWQLDFNLDVARMFAMARLKIDPALINPGFIIDNRYVQ